MHRRQQPFGEGFYRTGYFKKTIRTSGVVLYTHLRRISDREPVPDDVRAVAGEDAICACKSLPALATETGLAPNTVRDRLRLLEEEGWLRRMERSGLPSAFVIGDEGTYFADAVIRHKTGVSACAEEHGTPTKTGRGLTQKLEKLNAGNRPIAGDYGVCSGPPTNFGRGLTPIYSSFPSSLPPLQKDSYKAGDIARQTPTKIGRGQKRSWETLPVAEWGYRTLWAMIYDKLADGGVVPSRERLSTPDYAKLKNLVKRTGCSMAELRDVAEFFCARFKDLRAAYKWHEVSPGLFTGFFNAIRAHKNGEPIKGKKRDFSRKFTPDEVIPLPKIDTGE